MAAFRRILYPVLLLLWSLSALETVAQSEMVRERNSLRGVDGFYLSLNIEGPASAQDALDFRRLHQDLQARLQEVGLPVWAEDRLPASERIPYLHVHINAVDAGRGLYPFSVEVRFYQAVRLARDPSATTVAATWSASIVGIASHDHLRLIPEAALGLLEDFIEDFNGVNL